MNRILLDWRAKIIKDDLNYLTRTAGVLINRG